MLEVTDAGMIGAGICLVLMQCFHTKQPAKQSAMPPIAAPTAMPTVAAVEKPEPLDKLDGELDEPMGFADNVDVTTNREPPAFVCVTTTTLSVEVDTMIVASAVV